MEVKKPNSKKRPLSATQTSQSSSSQKAPVFIRTLYALLKDCDDTVCRWSEDGTSVVIVDPARFAADVCPTKFRHRNFASFTRLLNMYGFHKVPVSSTDGKKVTFAHSNFVRGKEELLMNIQRKTTPGTTPGNQPTGVQALVAKDVWAKANAEIDAIQKRLRTDNATSVSTWMRKVIDLEREVKQLREDNARLREMEVEKAQLYAQLASQNDVIVNLIANHITNLTSPSSPTPPPPAPQPVPEDDFAFDDNKGPRDSDAHLITPSTSLEFEDNPSEDIDLFDLLDDESL